jgi:hypothetical protein
MIDTSKRKSVFIQILLLNAPKLTSIMPKYKIAA